MNTFVAFSGGKDSTALALLFPKAVPVFTDTGWEPEEIYDHLDCFEKVTGRSILRIRSQKYESMPDAISKKRYLPGHRARYCTCIFKIEPLNKLIKENLPAELLIGLRADEPEDVRRGNDTELEGLNIRYPMREQGLVYDDVIRICNEHDLLPEYPIYMTRGGCLGCFFKSPKEIRAMNALRPDLLDNLQHLEVSIQDQREQFAIMFPNLRMSIAEYRKRLDLFQDEEDNGYSKKTKQTPCGIFCHR